MEPEELEAILRSEIAEAATFIDSEISPLRAEATRYYHGRPFGDEKEGRSKVVSRDVRDTVMAIMPSLLRIFFSSEQVVEYVPRRDEDAEMAAQATDYVNYLLSEENNGFLMFWGVLKDGLTRKTGIIKYWPDESEEVRCETYTGIPEDAVLLLSQEPGVEIISQETVPVPQGGDPNLPPPVLYDLKINIRKKSDKICIIGVPPEEWLINRSAKSPETARFQCHRTEKTRSDLVAMGYTDEDLEDAEFADALDTNQERLARQPWIQTFGDQNADESMRLIAYFECYIRVDFDGDGIAELRKACLIGNKLVHHEPTDEAPFAVFCPDPEPHVVFGNSIADAVMDIQRIKSQVMRSMLNSLAQSVDNRLAVVDGQVNMDDVLNPEVGGVIRMRQPGMVQELVTTFNGQAAFPVLQYMDDTKEQRTGITKASQGLSADVLQSTTKTAVDATVQAAQEHIEVIARVAAETTFKPLFKGLLRLVTTHQNQARIVKLRGKFVQVNPSEWDASMDVSVNVGLGGGTKEDKLQTLGMIASKQEAILMQLGPMNPLCNASQYAYTLRKMTELSGFRDSSQFFNAVPANYQPPPQQPPPPDPKVQAAVDLSKVKEGKIQSDIQKSGAELSLKREEMYLLDARERERIAADERVRLAEISAKYSADVQNTQAQIDAENARIRQEVPGEVTQ